jgi:hypothetical protein
MMYSQKIEVGHTLESPRVLLTQASTGGFSNHQKQVLDNVLHYLSKSCRGFAQIIYVQLQFFDHLAHNFIAKRLMRYFTATAHRLSNPFPTAITRDVLGLVLMV